MRHRLARAFDEFWDVRALSHEAVVQRMLDAKIDIAIDLKGFTRESRPSVLLRKPAPIVVNYLGYPGTMGASAYDYLIGDHIVTPTGHAGFYAEHLVQMPNSYQVNDTRRIADPAVPTREEEGLPATGFVFAAFNNVYKITPHFFEAWMRLLAALPGSVLWLLSDSEDVRRNLRAQASALGIQPERLVFARRVPLSKHLARHAHAGLLLDNLPYNAHTTTSDALWMGVPVVTCIGNAFAGRVAASLLHAVGLKELVAHSLPEYEAMALRLALDASELQRLRNHLVAVRATAALFDVESFTAHLESAFEHMYHRWQQGLPAQAFAVERLGSSVARDRSLEIF
jgi:predicted O-linked N-acetylglucosamine transferase (SPINDLY family)